METTTLHEGYLAPRKFMPRLCRLLPELEYPKRLNLTEELLDRNLAERADKIAIYYESECISYRELHSRVNKFANALRDLGV